MSVSITATDKIITATITGSGTVQIYQTAEGLVINQVKYAALPVLILGSTGDMFAVVSHNVAVNVDIYGGTGPNIIRHFGASGTIAEGPSRNSVITGAGKYALLPAISPEPIASAPYKDFGLKPSTHPIVGDVMQGSEGDCFFMASLAAVALVKPQRILDCLQLLLDGSVLVTLYWYGKPQQYRFTTLLPANPDGKPHYGGLPTSAGWAPLLEKAYAIHLAANAVPSGPADYARLDGGSPDRAFMAMGATDGGRLDIYDDGTLTGAKLVEKISLLYDGHAICFGTLATTKNLTGGHCYTLESIVSGNPSGNLGLYDPRGRQVFVTGDEALAALLGVFAAAF